MDHPKWVSSLCGRLNIVIYYAGMIIVGTMCGHQARAGTGGGELSLVFSTYLGGSGGDYIRDVTTDRNGNIYLAGYTASPNFPTTPGAYDRTFNGWHDVIVAKLDPVGKLQWSTFIGGPNFDLAMAIEVDSQGYVYIAGSAGPGFPVSAGAFQTTFQGYYTGSA